jgi:enamine deaminase RidA (YjgF/YER057c/UK114 family)
MSQTIAEKLKSLGHTLPVAAAPVANYVPFVQSGNLLYVSGQISQENGAPAVLGHLGRNLSVEDGKRAATLSALNVIAQIDAAVGGDLSKVKRIIKLGVFVASTPEFTEQPQVANGASDLFVAVFGDAGRHARAAVGVSALPRGVSVEIDAVVELA